MTFLDLPSLPASWRRVRVKDVADSIQYGHTASAIQREGGPRFLRITDIQDGRVDWQTVPSCDIPAGEISKYRLAEGDLVFARTGATTGKSYLIGKCPEAVFASYLIRVRVTTALDSKFLAAFFQSPDYWQQVEGGKRGIGQPNVNGRTLGEVMFPLPPLDEQRQIVAEIEQQFTRLDMGVMALRQVQAKLKRYRVAVLRAAYEGRLVPTEAETWKQTTIREAVQIIDYRGRTPPFSESGIPHLRSQNIRHGKIVYRDLAYVSEIDYNKFMTRGLPKEGDLLFTTEAPMGEVALAPTEKFSVAQRIMILRPLPEVLDSRFLMLQLTAPQFQARLRHSGTGSTVTGVSSRNFQSMTLVVPPLAEQTRIVAEVERRFSVVDELEAVTVANLKRAARLRQSILKKAFSGNSGIDKC